MSKLCFFPILLLTGGLAAVRASTPLLSELPLQDSVTVHKEITWKFKHPMRVGTFVNSDFYVVGPCTVTAISPSPPSVRPGTVPRSIWTRPTRARTLTTGAAIIPPPRGSIRRSA